KSSQLQGRSHEILFIQQSPLPADYREQNFRGGGRFDWASCRAVE
ncbi:hypothetical protein ACRE7P_24465, partial [Klebsiella pneumoniae]